MSKYLFTNRLFMSALGLFILFVTGCLFYLQYVEQQNAKEHARTEERLKQWREQHQHEAVPTTQTPDPPKVETSAEETTPDGHSHDDEWHAEPRTPGVPPATAQGNREQTTPVAEVTQTYDGPLTYHAELLETHPVEALRQHAREIGHWSAEHIPPFPPEDSEAAEFARNTYLFLYYMRTGQTEHPAYPAAGKAQSEFFNALTRAYDAGFKTPWEAARNDDLMKLTWPVIPPLDVSHTPWATTFTEADGINLESARPLFPFELDKSLLHPASD